MKKRFCIPFFMFLVFPFFGENNDTMDYYLTYSRSTDPGKYEYLYSNLPDTLPEIFTVIHRQLIHPARLNRYPELKKKTRDDDQFENMEDILAELVRRNPKGLILERQPEERLILACGHFARFMVSVMRYKKIPARIRVGFAPYLAYPGTGKHIDHWICEIWNQDENRWLLVDADLQMTDFEPKRFDFPADAWKAARKKKINPDDYGYENWWGIGYIRGNLLHDFLALLNEEQIYWKGPELFHKEYQDLTREELKLLDQIAALLKEPDKNREKLRLLRKEKKELQNIR